MGKKSRLKREAAAAAPPPAPMQRKATPYLVLVKPPVKTDMELMAELKEALANEAENERIERLNNLPMGHPENLGRLALTFDPIELWMDDMARTGETEFTMNDIAIFKPRDESEYFPIVESFTAVCDTYELIAGEKKIPDGSGALRRLARMIEFSMPISQRELDAAKAAIEWMKEVTKPLTPMQFSEYTVAIQIRATMKDRGLCSNFA